MLQLKLKHPASVSAHRLSNLKFLSWRHNFPPSLLLVSFFSSTFFFLAPHVFFFPSLFLFSVFLFMWANHSVFVCCWGKSMRFNLPGIHDKPSNQFNIICRWMWTFPSYTHTLSIVGFNGSALYMHESANTDPQKTSNIELYQTEKWDIRMYASAFFAT